MRFKPPLLHTENADASRSLVSIDLLRYHQLTHPHHPFPSTEQSSMKKALLIALCISPLFTIATLAGDAPGPLLKYVQKADDSYEWKVRRSGTIGKTKWAELILTSQKWRDMTWRHQLFVILPSSVKPDTDHCLLYITGGTWKDSLADPPGDNERLPNQARSFAALAEQVQTPVAVLLQVPRQPIMGGLYEDGIISLTFAMYFASQDPEVPLLLPMVKSAVKAMDATEEFLDKEWKQTVKTFTLTGASKRGWTTWLTGAVDKRAVALAPMVIDVLNIDKHMEHQVDTWGRYSEMISDYTDRRLHQALQTPTGRQLQQIVDPYSYRDKLKQPKLIMIGTNDRYWPLDSLNLYWNDLVGDNYILYVPNCGHGLNDVPRVVGSLNALNRHAAFGAQLPNLTWDFQVEDTKVKLQINSDMKPKRVLIWTATSDTRDFRDAAFSSTHAEQIEGRFVGELNLPADGYRAVFGEAMYEGDPIPYYFSTNVRVLKRDK